MASTTKKTWREGVLSIIDGSGTPKTVDVILGTGNLTFTISTPMEYETNRGVLSTGNVRAADDVPLELSLTSRFIDLYSDYGGSSDEIVTPYEAMYQKGQANADGWVSAGSDACEPYAVDLQIVFDPVCPGGGTAKTDETILFPEFRCESCVGDIEAGTLVFNGKCKDNHPTITRVQSV